MTKSEVPSLIDAVEIGNVGIEIAFGAALRHMNVTAKYALVVTKTGARVGAGTRTAWGDETIKRLRELIESMELDISEEVFGVAPSSNGGGAVDDHNGDGVPEL